jgi:hypothetical protein
VKYAFAREMLGDESIVGREFFAVSIVPTGARDATVPRSVFPEKRDCFNVERFVRFVNQRIIDRRSGVQKTQCLRSPLKTIGSDLPVAKDYGIQTPFEKTLNPIESERDTDRD